MVEALRLPAQKARAYRALSGSPGWFEHFHRTFIADAMSEDDENASQMIDVLARAWSFAPLNVEQLLRDRWAPYPEHDTRTWWALQNAPHWTDEVLGIACSIVQRTDIGPFHIDHVIGTIGVNQPKAALQLVRTRLDHELDIAQAHSAELAKEEKPEFDSGAEDAGWSAEEVAWAFEKNPKIPLKKLIEDRNGWDTLPTLAEHGHPPRSWKFSGLGLSAVSKRCRHCPRTDCETWGIRSRMTPTFTSTRKRTQRRGCPPSWGPYGQRQSSLRRRNQTSGSAGLRDSAGSK